MYQYIRISERGCHRQVTIGVSFNLQCECAGPHMSLVVGASKYHQLKVGNNAGVAPSCGDTPTAGRCLHSSRRHQRIMCDGHANHRYVCTLLLPANVLTLS